LGVKKVTPATVIAVVTLESPMNLTTGDSLLAVRVYAHAVRADHAPIREALDPVRDTLFHCQL
jgi:hypothetical protein